MFHMEQSLMEADFSQDLFGQTCEPPTSPKMFSVKSIPKSVASAVYKKSHYFGDKGFLHVYSFGALFEGYCWGALTFGIPNARNIKGLYESHEQQGVLEITRLAFEEGAPRNSPSRLISQAIKMVKQRYPLRLIITYADTAQDHDGGIYKASNFKYHGLTAQKTDFVHPDGMIRKMKGVKYSEMEGSWVPRSRKHLFSYDMEKRDG